MCEMPSKLQQIRTLLEAIQKWMNSSNRQIPFLRSGHSAVRNWNEVKQFIGL